MNEELDATKPLKKDLNTYDICLIKEFMHLITRELELLYINLDSRFKDVKASIKVELRNYSKFRKIESVSDDFANYIHRIFGIILDLYKIAHTNKVVQVKEKIENLTMMMYNENVIDGDYMAEFFYNLATIELSLKNIKDAIVKIRMAIKLLDGRTCDKCLDYNKRLFDLIPKVDETIEIFDEAYEDFRQILIEYSQNREHRAKLRVCLDKVYQITIARQDVRKFDDLAIVIKGIMEDCGESENVTFYLHDVYEDLLGKQCYFKTMHFKVVGEGAQAKRLLIKMLKKDDVGIAKVIASNIGIAETTAYSYLSRSLVPSCTFRSFMESTFGLEYSDLIKSPNEQILESLHMIASSIEEFCSEAGLEKVNYFYKKSVDLKYSYGEIFSLIYIARFRYMLKYSDSIKLIDKAITRAKKIEFGLFTLAVAEKAYILNFSGGSSEAVRILELHRNKIKDQCLQEGFLGKFYYQLGLAYRKTKDYKKAKRYMEMAYSYSLTTKHRVRRLNIIGLILRSQGKYTESLRTHSKVFELTSSKVEHAMAYNNIVYVYIALKEYAKAFEFVGKAIELIDDIKLSNQKINYYDTLFELILLTGEGHNRFIEAFCAIEKEFFCLDEIFEYFGVVSECVKKMVLIIIRDDNQDSMRKLLNILNEAISYYDNAELKNKVRAIFAETILSFINEKMIEGVL